MGDAILEIAAICLKDRLIHHGKDDFAQEVTELFGDLEFSDYCQVQEDIFQMIIKFYDTILAGYSTGSGRELELVNKGLQKSLGDYFRKKGYFGEYDALRFACRSYIMMVLLLAEDPPMFLTMAKIGGLHELADNMVVNSMAAIKEVMK